jgi:uncharacterized protein involved in type VI secretion and phage assembly
MRAGTDLRAQTSQLWIKVNGTELDVSQVVDVVIEQDLMAADSFTIRLRDVDDRSVQRLQTYTPLLDADRFPIGAQIEIGLGREERPEPVLVGIVMSLELEARHDAMPVLTVRGYDVSHKMRRERKSRAFLNVSDGDIVRQIAREYGLNAGSGVERTAEIYQHVFQDNQTDWDFLQARARRIGYELFIEGRTLYFRKPRLGERGPELELHHTLSRVRVRLSAPAQVSEVVVKGWDPVARREIVGRAARPSLQHQIGEDRSGAQMASVLGNGRQVVVNQPVRTQREAEALAQSILDEIAGEYVQLEGMCLGDPRLRPGRPVTLKNIGTRFSGTYYLSAVTHRVTPEQGYLTHFGFTGRRPATLTALLTAPGPAGCVNTHNGRYVGVAVGLVTNNRDPDYGHRVKVKFPWLAEHESAWARIASPMAGAERGFFFLPEVGDEVLVAFEHGDINYPVVIGMLWNGRDKPPQPAGAVVSSTGKVNQRILKSRLGHTITLDDSEENPGITIVDKTGKNIIKLDSRTNELTISVEGNLSLNAKGNISITAQRNISITAQGNLDASAQVNASMEAKGGKATLKGVTGEVEASGPLTVKGAVVNIN